MKTKRMFTYVFLIIAALISIFPFIWMVISATNQSVDVTKGTLLPGTHLVENINNLFSSVDMWQALWNSAKISVVTTVLSLLVASAAGYGFEMYRSRSKDIVFNILLASMMIPFAAIMVPLFQMFAKVSSVVPFLGIDTASAVILPTFTTAFLIFSFVKVQKCFLRI